MNIIFPKNLPDGATRLMSQPTTRRLSFDELVDHEARKLATDLLEKELSKHNLPLPKESALQVHLKIIIDAKPELKDQAKANVEARKDSYSDALRAIGIEPTDDFITAADLGDIFGELDSANASPEEVGQ